MMMMMMMMIDTQSLISFCSGKIKRIAPRDVLLDIELAQGGDVCVACETIYCAVAVVAAVR
jgi:energy-converting hydrogenase Eha subunit C